MLLALSLTLLAGCGFLVGCSELPGRAPPAPVGQWDPARATQGLARWSRAAQQGDRPAFDAETSTVDPGFATTADALFDNLGQLGWVRWSILGDRREPGPGRRDQLGAGEVVVVATEVSWSASTAEDAGSPPPDTRRHRVWTTWVVQDGVPRLAGTSDGPARADGPTPSWWWEPVRVWTDDGLTVLAGTDGAGAGATVWGRRAARAWAAAREAGVGAARPDPDAGREVGAAVVEIPSSALVRDRVLGTSTRSPTAALTVADADGVHPVVVDPGANLTGPAWELVLTHELVHVLTRSPGSESPRWLVEGLAESVAREAYPGVAAAGPEQAREALEGPTGLPSDADLAAGSGGAYLRAWVAVRLLQERSGRAALLDLVATTATGRDVGPGLQDLDWSLPGLDTAVEEALAALAAGRPVDALR